MFFLKLISLAVRFLTIVVFFVFVNSSSAQSSKMEVGLVGGFGLSNYVNSDGDFNEEYVPTFAYHVGGFARFNVSRTVGIKTGISFYNWGTGLTIISSRCNLDNPNILAFEEVKRKGTEKEHFLAVPISLEYEVLDKVNLILGLQVGMSLVTWSKFEPNPDPNSLDLRNDTNRLTPGFHLIVGVNYSVTDNVLFEFKAIKGGKDGQTISSIQLGAGFLL